MPSVLVFAWPAVSLFLLGAVLLTTYRDRQMGVPVSPGAAFKVWVGLTLWSGLALLAILLLYVGVRRWFGA